MIQCKLCGNFYRQDKTYRDHLTKHTNEKHFKCPHCPEKFGHQNSLHHPQKELSLKTSKQQTL